MNIVRNDEGGLLGRLELFQEHPYEGPTNYTGLVCIRCNFDLQRWPHLFASIMLIATGAQLSLLRGHHLWSW